MFRTITIRIEKADYLKIMGIVSRYASDCVRVTSVTEAHDEIEFVCPIWKLNRCRHDFNLAIALGIEIEVEAQ